MLIFPRILQVSRLSHHRLPDFPAFPFIFTVSLRSKPEVDLGSLSSEHSQTAASGHADGRGEEPSIYMEILLRL